MSKKYLETKKDSLESSVLGVWQTAIEEGDARETAVMDGRTKGYRDHRSKLEANRQRRESKKVNKEEVELDEELSSEEEWELFNEYMEMSDEEFDDLINEADEIELEGIFGAIGKGIKKVAKRATVAGRAGAAEKKVAKRDTKAAAKVAKKAKKASDRERLAKAKASLKKKKPAAEPAAAAEEVDLDPRKLPDMRDALMQVRTEKHDTHVDPKDREELDIDVKNSAKKMKKAQEPAPGQMTEAQSGDKEAYKKFFDGALKKFKINSPADLKSDEEKKKFYDYIDKNWEGDDEKAEGAMSQVREFKIQAMKAALAQVWGMEEGKNPFKPLKKEDHDDEENKKKAKTETGKKPAVIDLKPKIKD